MAKCHLQEWGALMGLPKGYMSMSGSSPGRPRKVSDEDILAVFKEAEDPVLSTAEVSKELPIQRSATYKRLSALREAGALNGKEIGGRNTVWWIPEPEAA